MRVLIQYPCHEKMDDHPTVGAASAAMMTDSRLKPPPQAKFQLTEGLGLSIKWQQLQGRKQAHGGSLT